MMASHVWVTRGFEAFRRGTFGNAGQNLYVSRAGVLQRIHHMDLDGDGHVDLLVCNSQEHWERPPVYVYQDVLGDVSRIELPSDGSLSATVADLNGDGYDDLVLAMDYNGTRFDLNAFVYYGSPQGLSERWMTQLPAPSATCVAAGDFNGDGRPDLAFVCSGRLRVFTQTELGFESSRFVDLDITAGQVAAADLDADGCADLLVLEGDGTVRVYWGGPEGLDSGRTSVVSAPQPVASEPVGGEGGAGTEHIEPTRPRACVLRIAGVVYILVPHPDAAHLVPVRGDRTFGEPMVIPCPQVMAAAAGDVNGDGHPDLVFASRGEHDGQECSWVYWGSDGGFSPDRRTPLPSTRACDVAVGDLDGDGCADIALCQDRTPDSFTFHCLVYRGGPQGVASEPVWIESHDARRIFIARTADRDRPQVIVVNHRARNAIGDVDVAIYFGSTAGFAPQRCQKLRGRDAVDAVCCDLDDDGRPEVVLANCSENAVHLDPGSYVFVPGRDGYPGRHTYSLPTTRAHGVACADLNRDGYLDLVFVGFSFPEILIFYGGPQGLDTSHPQRIRMEADGVVYDDPRWVYLADLNNDGWLDLVVPQISADRSFILWGGPEGFSMERRQLLAVWHGSCAQAADLTGNGYLDLIIAGHSPSPTGPHDSFVYIYWNGPEGLREDRRMQLPANGVNAMAVADFNNDGLLDLFVCNYHDGRSRDIDSFIYWGQPGGGFSAANFQRLFMHSASGCVAADFNGDGWVDLAVAYHKVENDHLGYSEVWWNGPEGFRAGNVTRLPSSGPHGMVRVGTGNQADRGPEEYYISEPFQLPPGHQVSSISWEADVPSGTWIRGQLRFAATQDALATAPWQGPADGREWFEPGNDASDIPQQGPWVSYRLALGAPWGCRTPRVTEVRVAYKAVR